ncbi:unnamed protein product [Blepharisma stoltei]|uniref:Acyl-coenzyme A oxidase n=1 Tax=Blepharisma stoltei TaxID=1481888 RepID=A0AAU9K826_9CILI|nr:unnamed protein product [Blepharisma stoltei]
MGLEEERKKVTFNVEKLGDILIPQILPNTTASRVREITQKAIKNPDLYFPLQRYSENREDTIDRGLRHGLAMKNFIKSEKLSREESRILLSLFPELTSIVLHYEFFLPSFELQASESQKAEMMEKIMNLEIIGCYAQTELGHGSNIRGIETEAIYDVENETFVMNSPTVTSAKWWIGGLGVAATHALVVAKLFIKNQDYGPHTFLIQIRDMKTHEPLCGVTVGDIGPKFGTNANDNGFLIFDHMRVPRECMLTRFARVNENGDYEILNPNALKILYSSMVKARVLIFGDSWYSMAHAATIAIRYSLIREQFPDHENPSKERQLIDYQIQRSKLFTVLSLVYANIFARTALSQKYQECELKMQNDDDSMLGEMHILSSLYKGFATAIAAESVEMCRRSCGGHGYSMYSGIPIVYTMYIPACTYEGDNSILILQAAKFITALLRNLGKGKKLPNKFAFLAEPIPVFNGIPDAACPAFHQKCFQALAHFKLHRLAQKEQKLIASGIAKEKIWTDALQVEAIEACEPLYHASIHEDFARAVENLVDPDIKQAVENLRQIYAVSKLEKFSGILLRVGLVPDILEKMKDTLIQVLNRVRNDAIGLVETFEFSDEALCSVIGRKDGNIYPAMIDASKNLNPINKEKVFAGMQKYLRPKL